LSPFLIILPYDAASVGHEITRLIINLSSRQEMKSFRHSLCFILVSTLGIIPSALTLTQFIHCHLKSSKYRLDLTTLRGSIDSEDNVDPKSRSAKSSRIERIKNFAKTIIPTAGPKAIADILTDATYGAVDLAVDEVSKVASLAASAGNRIIRSRAFSKILEEEASLEGDTHMSLDKIALAKSSIADAFLLAEQTIKDAEIAIERSKIALSLVSNFWFDSRFDSRLLGIIFLTPHHLFPFFSSLVPKGCD
jgi:hypothetical protein